MRHKKLSVLLLIVVVITAVLVRYKLPSLNDWIGEKVGEFGTGREAEQVENMERDSDRQIEEDRPSDDQGDAGIQGQERTETGLFIIPEMEETVLVDENHIKITATNLKFTNSALEIDLLIENNSDKNLNFLSGTAGYSCDEINGYMMDGGYLNTDVVAGKKAYETIRFDLAQFLIFGIREIADIRIGFEIQDENYDSVYTGARQIKISVADEHAYEKDTYVEMIGSGVLEKGYDCTVDYFAEQEWFNQNEVRIISAGLLTNSEGEKLMLLEVVNDSKETISSVTKNIAINGVTVCSYAWSHDLINPGARRILDFSISDLLDELYRETLGITEIGSFGCMFYVEDAEGNEKGEAQKIEVSLSSSETAPDITGTELYSDKGITVISKGLFQEQSGYTNDINLLMLVYNGSDEPISVDVGHNSLSVNAFMIDFYTSGATVQAGEYAIMDVKIRESSLKDNKISGIEDIKEMEMSLTLRNRKYDDIAEPKVILEFDGMP